MSVELPKNEPVTEHHSLTRRMIEDGALDAIVTRDAPGMKLLTQVEREASLREFLAQRPDGSVWIFGYGSLIWNPVVRVEERRTARIEGWHRAFCLTVRAGRGSPENPGLVLALDRGGSCTGIAFRLADEGMLGELSVLWKREMIAGLYVPRWVELKDAPGESFGHAIAFTINEASESYASSLTPDVLVARLATASGALGSSADYLFQTCAGLRLHGIPDAELERLAERVEAARAEKGSTALSLKGAAL
jgi:glutathione-specific gamma-glutamylcyclotransferase